MRLPVTYLCTQIMLQNDLLLRAARGEATERPPVWLMRQAGRILPEYRAVRSRISGFKELVETPELAAEVTLQPVDLLGVDAAIIFSDILVVPEAMGCTYEMVESRGPMFPHPIRTAADAERLRIAIPEESLAYVPAAIKIAKERLANRVPLIGFAGAPFTLLAYMVEGGGSKTFSLARKMLVTEPALAHSILEKLTATTIAYLKAQIAAGADLVQIFDSWAGILSPQLYYEFSLPYIEQICRSIQEVPVTVFAKGAFFALDEFAQAGASVVGIDWNTPPHMARVLTGGEVTLQGNLDPADLYGSPEHIRRVTTEMIDSFGPERYIANLGHGVYPDTDPDMVRVFVDAVKTFDNGKWKMENGK